MNVRNQLREHIAVNYMGGDAAGLEDATPLLELNIIDSVAIFDLLHYIRTEMGVTLPIEDVSPDNFGSIASIASLVERAQES